MSNPGAFSNLNSLVWIGLAENQLAELEPGVFTDLTSLRLVELYGNQFNAEQKDAIRNQLPDAVIKF